MALKVYWPGQFVDDAATPRFLRSMRATIPLRRGNLIRLHAAGRSGGLCFTATEWVAGEGAAEMVRRAGAADMLDRLAAWRIAVGAAEALSYLHDR